MNSSNILCNTNWFLDPEVSRSSITTFVCIQSCLILLTLFANSAEVIVVWSAEDSVGTNKTILLSLCISDLLHGLITQVVYTTFLVFQLYGRNLCFLTHISRNSCLLLTHVSVLSLWLASAERYLCIIHPFLYQRYLYSGIWRITVAVVWGLSILITILCYFFHAGGLALVLSIFMSCIGIGLINIKIAIAAMKARREIRQQHACVGQVDQRGRQSAKLFALLIALTIICYAPFCYGVLVTRIGTATHSEKKIVNWLWCLLTVSSVLNPICYCLMNKTLRRRCLKLFKIGQTPNLQ